jgi:flagellar basal-body rod protein FlgG
MATIGNNVANVNTIGFKSRGVSFKDALYTTMTRPEDPQTMNLQKGSGVIVSATGYDFSAGAPEVTENPLDVMIEGEGFFMVENQRGEVQYTRDGMLSISVEEGGRYLTTAGGRYMLDEAGRRIRLPNDAQTSTLSISETGELPLADDENFARLGLVSFPNQYGLEAAGHNCYAQSAASGAPQAAAGTVVRQGYLEASNVDMAEQMTQMIRASRAYSFASRVVSVADQMDGIANDMR